MTIGAYGIEKENDTKNEVEFSWSSEVFDCIIENLRSIRNIKKIVLNEFQQNSFRIWIAIDKDDEEIKNNIYKREIKIIDYISIFSFDIDFHIITEDMVEDIVDANSKIIYNA
jgi:hypothetical protein